MDVVRTNWFDLDNEVAYRHWRERRLEQAATRLDELLVEVRDPRRLSAAEHEALLSRCRRNNMALYASRIGDDPDKEIPRRLGEQLGLQRLDHNWLADDDGITSLTVNPEGEHPQYIPYTNRPIHWHTDGYYNPPERQIHGLLLHCVHPAARGGENALMDPELAYIHLRDADPAYVAALMRPDAMTIPEGTGEAGGRRPESVGPVFSVTPETGALHMRYTARSRNIRWAEDVQVQAAVRALTDLLASDRPGIFRGRLESGMGLVSNNVLHDRAGFEDTEGVPPRLLYRARFYDRIVGA
ncbi:taurine catabolism dioxygenase TauD [Thiohalobacter thiocyanaticus]|uniref:Taurine catabolism dioxygenase TauD n=2 Tax=Thiohalobacter thiocyanaticus TaxID=585455 RepID=A0A426QIH1_9GAMM|nr:taurine catabolism dioxygenase TauD [Thiohalobacter thiocyanaticus]